jgi:putative transposase
MENSAHLSRRSIRLPGYDYSAPGEYFITICAHERQCIFGEIVDHEMQLNEAGKIVWEEWQKTSVLRSNIELGAFVVMPNHIHAIIHILEEVDFVQPAIPSSPRRGDRPVAPTNARGPSPRSVGAIMAGFKSVVTTRINTLRQTPGMPVWQRNYYEHIISTEKEYLTIEAYIENNPANWMKDSLYPSQGENGNQL